MSHVLSITCFIAAPPENVWQVMTERQNEWWCPVPWRAEVDFQDRRPGGRCEMTMYGPDGEVQPQNCIYLAWDEGRRFVSTDAFIRHGDEFTPAGPFMVGTWEVSPAEQGGISGTLYTASADHWTEEAMRQHDQMGFTEGWQACAAQLKALCEAK